MDRHLYGHQGASSSRSEASYKETLRHLREDVRRLNGRLDILDSAPALGEAAAVSKDIAEPLENLEDQLNFLRQAAASRFQAVETRAQKLEACNAAIAEQLHLLADKSNDMQRDNNYATEPHAQRSFVSQGAASMSLQSKDTAAVAAAELQVSHSNAYERRNSPVSPARSRTRKDSPDKYASKRRRLSTADGIGTVEPTEQLRPPSANNDGGPTPFEIPPWAASTQRQHHPLPEGEKFVCLIQAIRNSTAFSSRYRCPTNATVTKAIKQIDPDIFQKYNVCKWSDFLTLAQAYVAVVLQLPPVEPDLRDMGSEFLVLLDPPFYSEPVCPPNFNMQVERLCKAAGIIPNEWINRKRWEGPFTFLPVQPPPRQLRPVAPHFPWLLPNIAPDCAAYLQQPTTFYDLVDVMRERKTFMQTIVLWTALRDRAGEERWVKLLDDCLGLKRWLGAASRFVKIRWLDRTQFSIVLDNLIRPFYEERDNEEYFRTRGGG